LPPRLAFRARGAERQRADRDRDDTRHEGEEQEDGQEVAGEAERDGERPEPADDGDQQEEQHRLGAPDARPEQLFRGDRQPDQKGDTRDELQLAGSDRDHSEDDRDVAHRDQEPEREVLVARLHFRPAVVPPSRHGPPRSPEVDRGDRPEDEDRAGDAQRAAGAGTALADEPEEIAVPRQDETVEPEHRPEVPSLPDVLPPGLGEEEDQPGREHGDEGRHPGDRFDHVGARGDPPPPEHRAGRPRAPAPDPPVSLHLSDLSTRRR
jgi:hypothetical protein